MSFELRDWLTRSLLGSLRRNSVTALYPTLVKCENVENVLKVENDKNVDNVKKVENVKNVVIVVNVENVANVENVEYVENVVNVQKQACKC